MFSTIAGFSQKYRVAIILIWFAVAAGLFLAAPKFADVSVTDETQFLPQDTQSSAATKLLKDKFAGAASLPPSSGIIVIYNAAGLSSQDNLEAKAIRDWLLSAAAPRVISGVTSIFDNDLLRQTLVSSDGTTEMMQVNFSVPALDQTAKAAVTQIRAYLASDHAGLQVYLTGETGLTQDLFQSIQNTISKTTIVTVVLLLVILLIIYRSPVAALLPLIAIGCSVLASIGILGFMGQAGVKFFTLVEAYLVVIIFGIGTDYCLFIVSRLREERKKRDPDHALEHSMKNIGPVIAGSAATVIVAFLCLGVSRFGMNRTSGFALAIGIGVVLIANLTLIPALVSLFGKHLFWPDWKFGPGREGRFGWAKIGDWVVRHPLIVTLPIIILLLIPYATLFHFVETNDIVSEMPGDIQSVQGYKLLQNHFPAGQLYPGYLLIQSPGKDITAPDSRQSIAVVAGSLQTLPGVVSVDYYASQAGKLASMAQQVQAASASLTSASALQNLSALQASVKALPLQYPGVVQSQNFLQIVSSLTALNTLAGQFPGASQSSLPGLLFQLQTSLNALADNLDGLAGEFNLTVSTPFTATLLNTYFSTDKTTARINIIMKTSPYAPETANTVNSIRKEADKNISASNLNGSSYFLGGTSAIRADIMLTNSADFGRVVGFAIVGILIVMIILLRSLVAPLYMVATVLFNYGATLGITNWIFSGILKQEGMIYMLPVFIFIILVALGADYNIFLVSRIREEAHHLSVKEAVKTAIANTGGVITSCGMILAGTFLALMITPLQMVAQLGAAIVIGVLIDTFVVRALLVPSIAAMAGKWSWWPSRLRPPSA
jgi:RND superfamily putative drug exporter